MKQKEKRLPIFSERFRKLQGDMSNTEFAAHLGMSRQTVGFYLNGDRVPDAVGLQQISEKCSVSIDWILGITNIPTLDQNEKSICDYTGLTLESVRALHCANNVLTRESSPELEKYLRAVIEEKRTYYAKQKKISEHDQEIANVVSAMTDADLLSRGIDMVSDILAKYCEDYDRKSFEVYCNTEDEKIHDYRVILSRLLYRINLKLIECEFTDYSIENFTSVEESAFRGNAELLLDAVNFGLSSDSAQELLRSMALIVFGDGEEHCHYNHYFDIMTRHGTRSINLNSSNLAVDSLLSNLQRALLHEREVNNKRYSMTVAE